MRSAVILFAGLVFSATALAQTPPPPAKRLPPAGLAISETDRAELTAGAAKLRAEIDELSRDLARTPTLVTYLPDIEIFHKAVDWALRYDEFFAVKEVATARHLLAEGHERAGNLREGRAPWLEATGLVVRGYRSKLDGSVQPYGLVVPRTWQRQDPSRLQVWLLGRGDKRTELAFIAEREAGPPQIVPRDTLVLIPYGRFCNATKFAGEVDVFEALAAVRRENVIDAARTSVAGFSMGGASTWHLATHFAGLWSSASPGAGFAETAIYTKAFAPGKEPPTVWEQKLWGWYDATKYAGNLRICPTVAYSGEIDPQKQSADLMEQAMAAEDLKLERLIGPKTAHAYEPATRKNLVARLEAIADAGRDPAPREVRATTYTLRYPGNSWVEFTGLAQHWERSDLIARYDDHGTATITTKNVTALHLTLPALHSLSVDGQPVTVPSYGADGFSVHRQADRWLPGDFDAALRKRPGLTGPVDDAFMESFVFVRPTGKAFSEKSAAWSKSELAHATKMWRDIFRGDAPVKDDNAITADDIRDKNLILWGDPSSNTVLAKLLATGKFPLTWDAKKILFRGQTYDAAHHAPILIFPNPLNPARYVVLNSGMDFRADAYGTNALQIPKLPDYAIIDLDNPPGPKWPGKIVDAGFFNEEWK